MCVYTVHFMISLNVKCVHDTYIRMYVCSLHTHAGTHARTHTRMYVCMYALFAYVDIHT